MNYTNKKMTTTTTTTTSSEKNASTLSLIALHQLQAPDGYYTYLNIPKPTTTTTTTTPTASSSPSTTTTTIDADRILKQYRRLSLKHHPDRPTGDAETFRLLQRAKTVLTNDRLRKDYDLFGLDLEEECGEDDEHDAAAPEKEEDDGDGDGDGGGVGSVKGSNKAGAGGGSTSSSSDSVINHMASATIASIVQLAIRTFMMGLVSTILTRYKYLLLPSILFLTYTSYRIFQAHRQELNHHTKCNPTKHHPPLITTRGDIVSPLIIAGAMFLMYVGRNYINTAVDVIHEEPTMDVEQLQLLQQQQQSADDIHYHHHPWSWTFWLGEGTVMTLFLINSLTRDGTTTKDGRPIRPSTNAALGCAACSAFLSLILRGKIGRYACVIFAEFMLAILALIAFPVMEMVLEEIMREKLRKVGEKVRAYAKSVEDARLSGVLDSVDLQSHENMNGNGNATDIDGDETKKTLKKRHNVGNAGGTKVSAAVSGDLD